MSESFSRETIRQLIKQQQQGPEQTFADTERKLRQKIERLEAKLAKAVECVAWCAIYEKSEVARTTLAELKGESHE